ncbi:MAG TPA: PadR family transcriptional regulator [Thermoanaerobaculia bacterium]|nr:PadR family transcriptional regulator [Thermoanaerobaculia bacterium]
MARRRSERADRTELECFVLGLIWQRGWCSPYDVRAHMARSPSTQWSASAGAIYPLVRRLEREGLLASRVASTGRRLRREYQVTAGGVRTLRRWLGPPLPAEAVTVSYDPLRSRARFLGVLASAERAAWIDAALQALDAVAAQVRAWHEEFGAGGDVYLELLTRSGEIDVEGRRRWLEVLRLRLGEALE